MLTRLRVGLAASVGLAITLLAGCSARLPGQPNEAERWRAPAEITDFNQLYTQNCAGCHGVGGKLGAARSLNDMQAHWSKPDDFKGVDLPRYSVDETATPSGPSTAINSDISAQTSQTGDALRGAATYKTYCASCHGTNGEGGSAGSIVDPNFLNLVSDQGLRTTVVVGRADMGKPDWRGNVPGHPMSAQEIVDVVAWLAAHRKMTTVAVSKVDHSACLNMK